MLIAVIPAAGGFAIAAAADDGTLLAHATDGSTPFAHTAEHGTLLAHATDDGTPFAHTVDDGTLLAPTIDDGTATVASVDAALVAGSPETAATWPRSSAARTTAAPHIVGAAELREWERRYSPRWVFDSAVEDYPTLLAANVRIRRCHDISLVERILAARVGRFDAPIRAAAVLARAAGQQVPDDPIPASATAPGVDQPGLFGTVPAATRTPTTPEMLLTAYRDQVSRITDEANGPAATRSGIAVPPAALTLLAAAESGSALVATDMTRRGMPWDAAVHGALLTQLLGPRPPADRRPARLADLAERIGKAFGFPVNPDSPAELIAALHRSGIEVESTRAHLLRAVDHAAIEPLLAYKELARLWTANGWHWLDEWISADGRLRTQFLPGAVVSGRWATRGGGGLQLPAAIRPAARAKPGYRLVVADAAQLEPRIWATLANDPALTRLAQGDDLYTALAGDGFGGDRRHAKLAMLGAMYGQTSGEAARLMATMRRKYPQAVAFVEKAARRGETGGIVASILGRVCPPPSQAWRRIIGSDAPAARRAAADRGRFTRNFVIQASAADWAAAWITGLRLRLLDDIPDAEMVLFLHDEVVLHVPERDAEHAAALAVEAARAARDLVFPGSEAPLPVRPVIVTSYADAK